MEKLNEKVRFDNEELTRIKEETKTKYKEIGNRVIVPGNKFGKRFHLAKNKLKRYEQNPIDNAFLNNYNNGSKIYLVIFLSYTYQPEKTEGTDRTGEYLGILRLEKNSTYRNDQWIKEYVN